MHICRVVLNKLHFGLMHMSFYSQVFSHFEVFVHPLFPNERNKVISKSPCEPSQPVNEVNQTEKKLAPCVDWHKDERQTGKASPPLHTLFSLACYESIRNSFIACSNRIA